MIEVQSGLRDANELQSDEQPPTELSIEDALSVAMQLHRVGHFDDAEALYKRILETVPNEVNALHFLGILFHRRGNSDAGIDLIKRSIDLDPLEPNRYNNLGNVLKAQGKPNEAMKLTGPA